jgi:DNA topoisomerase-1
LWSKIRYGLSAGRVQSPALRLITEREKEIQIFEKKEYWSIHLDTQKENSKFTTKLVILENKKIEQFTVTNEAKQKEIVGELILKSAGKTKISRVDKKQRIRKPPSPFTTSTMQQEGVRKLGFTTKRTMIIAQQLYEGIKIGEGAVGLISYMRTDSMTLSKDAVNQARDYLKNNYSPEFLPSKALEYKTKSKNAQEAHEAIRPTDISRSPEELKGFLSEEQFKLYEMIWRRTLACQMTSAVYDVVSVDLEVGSSENIFRANGQTIKFAGFMSVYIENQENDDSTSNSKKLPPLEVGEQLNVNSIHGIQHFTEPPPRYSEASLVKTLEEFGIGRPSTYASIISTLQERDYVLLDKKRFTPTDVGNVVIDFLTEHFSNYVDYDFTAHLETELDDIAANKKDWIKVLKSFWEDFDKKVKEKSELDRTKITQKSIDEDCPKCGKPLLSKLGRRGNFIACSDYPECKFTRSANGDLPQEPKVVGKDKQTNIDVLLLIGPYGPYLQLGLQDEDSKTKPKRVTIPPTIPLADLNEEIAQKLISLPRDLGIHPDTGKKIIANIGQFGPYVNHNGKFKAIPKSDDIFEISHDDAVELLKPLRRIGIDPITKSTVDVYKGRFGFYLQRDAIKVNIAKNLNYENINLEKAITLINKKEVEEQESKKKGKKKKGKK